jgi:hypothetical protein
MSRTSSSLAPTARLLTLLIAACALGTARTLAPAAAGDDLLTVRERLLASARAESAEGAAQAWAPSPPTAAPTLSALEALMSQYHVTHGTQDAGDGAVLFSDAVSMTMPPVAAFFDAHAASDSAHFALTAAEFYEHARLMKVKKKEVILEAVRAASESEAQRASAAAAKWAAAAEAEAEAEAEEEAKANALAEAAEAEAEAEASAVAEEMADAEEAEAGATEAEIEARIFDSHWKAAESQHEGEEHNAASLEPHVDGVDDAARGSEHEQAGAGLMPDHMDLLMEQAKVQAQMAEQMAAMQSYIAVLTKERDERVHLRRRQRR